MSSFFRTVSDSDSDSSSEEELLSGSEDGEDSGLEGKKTAQKAGAAPKKNRFLKGGSSDDDSDDDSDSDSDEDSDEDLDGSDDDEKPKKGNRFLKGADSETDSSEDEGKRIVKSAKSKRQEEVDASIKIMDNAAKINDWHTISNGALDLSCFANLFLMHKELCRVRQAHPARPAASQCRRARPGWVPQSAWHLGRVPQCRQRQCCR